MQKSLVFYLFALSFGIFASSCSFNPNMQGNGEAYLQGEWQQDSVPMQKQLVNYSLYKFRISCDSFYVTMNNFSRVDAGADTCVKNGNWYEYAKGSYRQTNDTLHLRGLFCNADMSFKDPTGCFRSGVYEDNFKVTKTGDSTIQFASTSSVIPITARLIKRTGCVPKAL